MTDSTSLTWWGHATTTIEIAGVRILTDPVLTRRVGHLSRIGGPVPGARARDADVVLVSHLHSDHLHPPSLRRVRPSARIVGPPGTSELLSPARAEIVEITADDTIEHHGVTIRAVPAVHDGRRYRRSRVAGNAMGYLIERGGFRVWFAGDTALFDGMSLFGPVDVAVVPIGGWGPTLEPDKHLDPEGAVEALRLVQARYAVPMHYATFWPTGLRRVHPPSFRRLFLQPADRFRQAIAATDVEPRVLSAGETTRWAVQ